MTKQFIATIAISLLTTLSAHAENTILVSFDFLVNPASQTNISQMAPVLNSVLAAGVSVPKKINPKVACQISLVKFDTEKTASGIALAQDTVRVEGVFECTDAEDTMAGAILFQQMRKWIRVDLSDATQLNLHFIGAVGPSVSGSN